MSHLTDGQFEDILQGRAVGADHLTQCEQCQKQLAEKKALAERLQLAFTNMNPPLELTQRIRETLKAAEIQTLEQRPRVRTRLIKLHKQHFSRLSIAATILIILAPVGIATSESHSQGPLYELAFLSSLAGAAASLHVVSGSGWLLDKLND